MHRHKHISPDSACMTCPAIMATSERSVSRYIIFHYAAETPAAKTHVSFNGDRPIKTFGPNIPNMSNWVSVGIQIHCFQHFPGIIQEEIWGPWVWSRVNASEQTVETSPYQKYRQRLKLAISDSKGLSWLSAIGSDYQRAKLCHSTTSVERNSWTKLEENSFYVCKFFRKMCLSTRYKWQWLHLQIVALNYLPIPLPSWPSTLSLLSLRWPHISPTW